MDKEGKKRDFVRPMWECIIGECKNPNCGVEALLKRLLDSDCFHVNYDKMISVNIYEKEDARRGQMEIKSYKKKYSEVLEMLFKSYSRFRLHLHFFDSFTRFYKNQWRRITANRFFIIYFEIRLFGHCRITIL